MKARIPEEGEIREDQVYHNGNWQTLDTGLTLYEVNQQLVAQLPDMTSEDIEKKRAMFNVYIEDKMPKYCMLLCNELKYYTVFVIEYDRTDLLPCFSEVVDCLIHSFEEIKSIELTEDKQAIEIWVKSDGEYHVMYFFDYTQGVIECMKR